MNMRILKLRVRERLAIDDDFAERPRILDSLLNGLVLNRTQDFDSFRRIAEQFSNPITDRPAT